MNKKIGFLVVLPISYLLFAKLALAKGPHTNEATYLSYDSTIGKDVCRVCHVPHLAEGKRLWPVGFNDTTRFKDTTAVTVIQKLCQYCHYQRESDATQQGEFYLGQYGAHILRRAHGQHGPRYDSTSPKRYGPGHLYRHSTNDATDRNASDTVQTRDNDHPIQGYGGKYTALYGSDYYNRDGYESMVIEADPDSTTQDYSKLSRLSCFSCHSPHANYVGVYYDRQGSTETYDYSQARNYILDSVGDVAPLKPTFYESVDNGVYIGRTRSVCLGCHFGGLEPPYTGEYTIADMTNGPTIIDNIIPPIPPGKTQKADTTDAREDIAAHYDGESKCMSCHPWDASPARCNDCHGYPPSASSTDTYGPKAHYPQDYNTANFRAFSLGGVGVHDTHVQGERYPCTVCHPSPAGANHNNETVDVVFDTTINFPGGTRISPSDTCIRIPIQPDDLWDTDRVIECRVACHNPVIGETTGYINSYNTLDWPYPPVGEIGNPPISPAFDDKKIYTLLSCVSCHEYQGTLFSPNTFTFKNASHHPYVTTSVITQRNSCSICHIGDGEIGEHQWIYMPLRSWVSKPDVYNFYGDNRRHRTHTSRTIDATVRAKIGGGVYDSSVFEWNLMVFNPISTPGFPNPSVAYSSTGNINVLRTIVPYYTRFIGNFDIYREDTTKGFCDPCHDTTAFEINYGTTAHHENYYNSTVLGNIYFRAPKAAAYFYESVRDTVNVKGKGIGGHGHSTTHVSEHKLGDSRASGDESRMRCRSCHYYHGSNIDKILDSSAMRPEDADTLYLGSYTYNTLAEGNDNTFCYRCHFFSYDNGFYSKDAYESSIHNTSPNFRIWDDVYDSLVPYAPSGGHPESYFWKVDKSKLPVDYRTGLCIYCHEPHGGYGWDSSVFDTPGFSSMTRGGTRAVYIDDSTYETTVDLGDEVLCFKCHNYDSTWNVYSDTVWSGPNYRDRVFDANNWSTAGLDISSYFDTSKPYKFNYIANSHHRVQRDEQDPGSLGNIDYLIIECINCHNPHTVRKDQTVDSTVENLMYPFNPSKFMYDAEVTDSSRVYKVYNKFCLVCHNEKSLDTAGYDGSNEQRGMVYSTVASLWGKLPRGISFSDKTKWGEGGISFHSWNKKTYYDSFSHAKDSTSSIGFDSGYVVLPLARRGPLGLACARIDEFACHDPHGSINISLLKDDVNHPQGNNYGPNIYDTTMDPADEPRNTDRWCGAACHQIGKRAYETDWSHAWAYVRTPNDSAWAGGAYVYNSVGDPGIKDVDIYGTTDPEPILDNLADMDRDTTIPYAHSSFSRVPGDGNNWPNNNNKYNTATYKNFLPVKSDDGTRFVCFTCHDPHGTRYRGMLRDRYETVGEAPLCLICH